MSLIGRYRPVMALGVAAIASASFLATARAQNLGSIGGTVRDETGLGTEAEVTISTQGFRQQEFSLPDGTFEFLNIRPGIYMLCAEPKLTGDPLVDACLWQDSSSAKAVVRSGQSLHGVVIPVVHGAELKIHVNDPSGKLPPPMEPISGNQLSMMVMGPSGLAQHVPIIAHDSKGRDLSIVIPYGAAHKLVIHSASLKLSDGYGNAITDAVPISVKASQGVQLPPIIVNVGGPK